ncbi:hypothetical protein ACIBF1_11940 [Spirillospora sp. NPDC050679]
MGEFAPVVVETLVWLVAEQLALGEGGGKPYYCGCYGFPAHTKTHDIVRQPVVLNVLAQGSEWSAHRLNRMAQ